MRRRQKGQQQQQQRAWSAQRNNTRASDAVVRREEAISGRGSTTYNRLLDRVRVVNDTRDGGNRVLRRVLRHVLRRVLTLALLAAFPILAGDNVRGARSHLQLATGCQLTVGLLHGGVLQYQTLDLLPFRGPFGNRRIRVLGVDDLRKDVRVPRHATGRRLIRIAGIFRILFRVHSVQLYRSSQSQGRGRALQLLAFPVSVGGPDFSSAALGMAGLVSTVSAVRFRVQ